MPAKLCECGCGRPVQRRFVHGHHKRVPLLPRFLARVQKTPGCWLWTGGSNANGRGGRGGIRYGAVFVKGQNHCAHRVAYELFVGPIPDGLYVLHRCDNGLCVNPAHLFVGTPKDNTQDMIRKGRRILPTPNPQRGEANVRAKLTWENVRKMRQEYAAGESQYVLAQRYGVAQRTVWVIVNNKTWIPHA